jgi:hypothetical protein
VALLTAGRLVRRFHPRTGSWDPPLPGDALVATLDLSRDGAVAACTDRAGTTRIWSVPDGQCLATVSGPASGTAVALSDDRSRLLVGFDDGTVGVWEIDWALAARRRVDWDEGARPLLDRFIAAHRPRVGAADAEPGSGPRPLTGDPRHALVRRGRPRYTEVHLREFLRELGHAGYGWLDPDGVRRRLAEYE